MAASMKMAVFWVIASNIRAMSTHRPDDGGSKHLWNVSKLLPDYTAQQPRRQPSSTVIMIKFVFSMVQIYTLAKILKFGKSKELFWFVLQTSSKFKLIVLVESQKEKRQIVF
jgi:hypothetical protein